MAVGTQGVEQVMISKVEWLDMLLTGQRSWATRHRTIAETGKPNERDTERFAREFEYALQQRGDDARKRAGLDRHG